MSGVQPGTDEATGTAEPPMVAAGRSIVAAAAACSIPVRLLGGVAIWLRGSPAARSALGRDYPDVDLVAHKRQSRRLRARVGRRKRWYQLPEEVTR